MRKDGRHEAALNCSRTFPETINSLTKSKVINPILPPHSADPWMIFHGGFFYYFEKPNRRHIFLRPFPKLTGLGQDAVVCLLVGPGPGLEKHHDWGTERH